MSSRTLFLDLASGKQCIALIEGEKTAALERTGAAFLYKDVT